MIREGKPTSALIGGPLSGGMIEVISSQSSAGQSNGHTTRWLIRHPEREPVVTPDYRRGSHLPSAGLPRVAPWRSLSPCVELSQLSPAKAAYLPRRSIERRADFGIEARTAGASGSTRSAAPGSGTHASASST